ARAKLTPVSNDFGWAFRRRSVRGVGVAAVPKVAGRCLDLSQCERPAQSVEEIGGAGSAVYRKSTAAAPAGLWIVNEPGPEIGRVTKWPLGAGFRLTGDVTGASVDGDLGGRWEFVLQAALLQKWQETCVQGIRFC